MNILQASCQAVIDHIAADIETLRQSGNENGMAALKERCEWLASRKDRLDERRDPAVPGLKIRLEACLSQCDNFWKERHGRTYEGKMDELLETRRRAARIYSLAGFDACHALLLVLKHLRGILPLPQYAEYAPALAALEAIKKDWQRQLATYIEANRPN